LRVGLRGSGVEMKNVEIPGSMQCAIAREASTLREKRARRIKAQAELEAAEQLRRACEIIMQNPAGLELRRMQMIAEVGAERNSKAIIMMPSELVAIGARHRRDRQAAVRLLFLACPRPPPQPSPVSGGEKAEGGG
jgi:regulator of protease activity HflC (stomatin/prohibitin superfamily)